MAALDWASLTGGLSTASLRRGVTAGFTSPNGGGSFVYAFNSAAVVEGAAGLVYNGSANFNPTPANSLGEITAAMRRGVSGGPIGFAPFIFVGLQGPDVSDTAYMLGLQDDDPSAIVLRKGPLGNGLPNGNVGELGILSRSTSTFNNNTWIHLRLECVVNGTGDVVINVYSSDVTNHSVVAPVWEPIPGMEQFIDDALGVNSGSLPLTSGRFGFGCYVQDISRRAHFDHITLRRQIPL